jgi:DNA-binding SARP family transcriptional activator/TolB-like protein
MHLTLSPTPPRYRLVTLGRLTLLSPDGREDALLGTRRRKLAVLAYLGLRGRPVTRDHLTALFWGGKEDARARNSLSDAISHLRRVIGRDVIITRGEEVALGESAAVDIDATDFRSAVDVQQWGRAVALYAGPFLEGVHIEDAADFEHWRAAEDQRLRRLFAKACAAHTLVLAEAANWEDCAELAARWLDAEPTCAEAALCRMNALSAPATKEAIASALADYERLRALLGEELGVGLDPEVEKLAASLREALPPISAPLAAPPAAEASLPVATEIVASRRDSRRSVRWRRTAIVAALLVASVTLVGALGNGVHRSSESAQPIVVILPFENLGAPGDAYFAEGLTQEVRARLANLQGLRVIGGSGTQRFAPSSKRPRDIARELGATHLLTGSVRWEHVGGGQGRVRVTPELLRVNDEVNVWGASVEGRLDDVFAIQAQVAERVAAALGAALHVRDERASSARPTANLAAYDAYLRGRSAVSSATTFSAADRQRIRSEFERAITLDPTFAAAHAQLAWIHLRDYEQAGNARAKAEALEKFRTEARRSWALDTTLVDTRLVHARELMLMGDRAAASRLVRETARMAPMDVEALSALASLEWNEGRYDAAVTANRRAMELDPLAANAWKDLAGDLDRLYRYDEAIAVREREIEVTPNSDVAYAVQASSHILRNGDIAAARQTLERGSLSLPWIVRLPGGVAGIDIWVHALPPAALHARDTLTLAGYLGGAGGIAPELYHLLELRHFRQTGRVDRARAHAKSLVVRLEPAVRNTADASWFFWWFSRRSVLAEAYATLGRKADAAREADGYVAESRSRHSPEQLCHALHNAAYVDVLTGRKEVATAYLTEALGGPCGHRVSRALLRTDSAWAPLWTLPAFEQLMVRGH